MKATAIDLRRSMKAVMKALEGNETVTILYRGKERGVLLPIKGRGNKSKAVSDHPAFGMWKDRADFRDVEKAVRTLRKGRFDAV